MSTSDYTSQCRHFNGIQNRVCGAGVNYRDLAGGDDFGWALRLPCDKWKGDAADPAHCDQLSRYTREEAEQKEAALKEHMDKMRKGLTACHQDAEAKGLRKGHGGVSSVPCPACEGGTLHYTVSGYNGHLWGKCTTDGCLHWMQ